ncbi:pilus assembly protein TadG-related protein [Virgibacillus senegalensis]|uniref:pilus assembly protein TadG-related protein n=1 Tax=Virgibacillus senegalensis TaxID=1499679 RepID=UPI00069FD9B2|nr:pilus assembly protein TadG-related protein [Virgibacillus senegalensis]
MKKISKNIARQQDGNALVLVALAMAAVLALTGLVVDGGHLYWNKAHLQKAANAAALSGAQEIVNSQENIDRVVTEILEAHEAEGSLLEATVENERQLNVVLEKQVPVFFSSIFGVEHIPIKVKAKAGLSPMGEAVGAVPLGIDESVPLQYGETYQLKVDAGDSAAGNFGVLALEGPGAKSYGDSLMYGFDDLLQVGDIVNTQTGNIAGATRSGINYRMDLCPNWEGGTELRDCPRIMLVIVYKPYSQTTNQMKSVEITGFAYFYVTERMGNTDDSIKGIFIKRAGAGSEGQGNPPDRGAYAIKLTE